MVVTPGVYFEQVNRAKAGISPLRTDITGLVGYTERGPLLTPVKLTSWRQFTTVFGLPLAFAYLGYAVRGFFENGGAACYVTRVADLTLARVAAVTLPDGQEPAQPALRLWASHGELHDPVTNRPYVENGRPVRFDSPGAWSNSLSVSLQPAGLGVTDTQKNDQPADGSSSFAEGLSGFETGSIVRLSQAGIVAPDYRRVEAINPHLRQIIWDAPLTGFDFSQPIRLETIEFTLLIHQDGQIVEQHPELSLSENHSRYLVDVIQANSRLVNVAVLLDLEAGEWQDPRRWPAAADRLPFSGGQDGLATIDKDDFLAGLATLALVDEISLLAAPDLILQATAPPPARRAAITQDTCHILAPPPAGQLRGVVLERQGEAEDIPLAGVKVALVGSSASISTNSNGEFILQHLPVGQVSLLLQRARYHDLEITAQARTILPAEPLRFYMAPLVLPPALSLDDIFEVQAAMAGQGAAGLYRVALLDPPPAMLGLAEIQTWRARFDSSFAALYYPWLLVNEESGSGIRPIPPSGYIAGLIARTDLAQGVHLAPANLILEGVKALSHEVNDAQQGLLNPRGINCLRVLPGQGIRVYGARTLSSDPEWRYLNVRRLLLMIEEAIEEAMQWAVFEPNNTVLRQALSYSLASFLNSLWRQGKLAGQTPAAAYRVRCDAENNPPAVVDAGQVIAEFAVAPTIPFEFIYFKLGRTVEAIEITES